MRKMKKLRSVVINKDLAFKINKTQIRRKKKKVKAFQDSKRY